MKVLFSIVLREQETHECFETVTELIAYIRETYETENLSDREILLSPDITILVFPDGNIEEPSVFYSEGLLTLALDEN